MYIEGVIYSSKKGQMTCGCWITTAKASFLGSYSLPCLFFQSFRCPHYSETHTQNALKIVTTYKNC